MHKDLYKIIGTKPENVLWMIHIHHISAQEAETLESDIGS